MDGLDGTRVWCGYGVFAHNSQKISGLIAEKDPAAARRTRPTCRQAHAGPARPARNHPQCCLYPPDPSRRLVLPRPKQAREAPRRGGGQAKRREGAGVRHLFGSAGRQMPELHASDFHREVARPSPGLPGASTLYGHR